MYVYRYLAMRETIRCLKEKYGSIQDYVQNVCGLSKAEIGALRELMIVRVPFEERQLFRPKI